MAEFYPGIEEEQDDILAFLEAYPRATGERLELVELRDKPDALCRKQDGTPVGVEHTRIRRSPDVALWESIVDRRDEMDVLAALEEIERLVVKKAERRQNYSTSLNILLIAVYETDFDILTSVASTTMLGLEDLGFDEIWLGDYLRIREGAHRELRLFGLHPAEYRVITERSMWDQKPYG